MTEKLLDAVRKAEVIRKRLVQARRRTKAKLPVRDRWWHQHRLCLQGACGLASVQLAVAIRDATTLRYNDGHVFNVIDGYVVDITATQFDSKVPPVFVVEMNQRRMFHRHIVLRGLPVARLVNREEWYERTIQFSPAGKEIVIDSEFRAWRRAYQRLLEVAQ